MLHVCTSYLKCKCFAFLALEIKRCFDNSGSLKLSGNHIGLAKSEMLLPLSFAQCSLCACLIMWRVWILCVCVIVLRGRRLFRAHWQSATVPSQTPTTYRPLCQWMDKAWIILTENIFSFLFSWSCKNSPNWFVNHPSVLDWVFFPDQCGVMGQLLRHYTVGIALRVARGWRHKTTGGYTDPWPSARYLCVRQKNFLNGFVVVYKIFLWYT